MALEVKIVTKSLGKLYSKPQHTPNPPRACQKENQFALLQKRSGENLQSQHNGKQGPKENQANKTKTCEN